MTPLLKIVISYIKEDVKIFSKWIKMYFRYFQNWLHESFNDSVRMKYKTKPSKSSKLFELIFKVSMRMLDSISKVVRRLIKKFEPTVNYFTDSGNLIMKKLVPKIEPIYLRLNRLLKPVTERLSQKLIDYVDRANPRIFEEIPTRR